MTDLISRSALIEEMRKFQDNLYFSGIHCNRAALEGISRGLDNAVSIIEEQPTVEPVRGEWIEVDDDIEVFYRCSNCGDEFVILSGTPEESNYKFCPNCGADMRKKV